jgi:hypothetical protein
MLETTPSIRTLVLSAALASASLCAFGQITEPPRPTVQPTAKALIAKTQAATVSPVLMKDVDEAARAPFQVSVPININNFTYTPVAIPAGQRLVIDYISYSGAAQTAGSYVQPILLLAVGVANNPSAVYYFGSDPSSTTPGQYYHSERTTIYADTLQVGPGFAGYTPTFMSFTLVITGHLITP